MDYAKLLEESWKSFRDGALPEGVKNLGEKELQSVRWVFHAGMFEVARLLFTDSDPDNVHLVLKQLNTMINDIAAQRMKYSFTKASKSKKKKKEKNKKPCTFAQDLGIKTNIILEFE